MLASRLCRRCTRIRTICRHVLTPTNSHSINHIRRTNLNISPAICLVPFSQQSSSAAQTAHVLDGESHKFEAETQQLLKIVAGALYSKPEVFVRELISNASDALEKLRYEVQKSGQSSDIEGKISITCDPVTKTFVIQDNGIGMTKEQLIENIGTIARSGTRQFLEEIKTTGGPELEAAIGKFGCGFYSTFMVADRVEMYTKSSIDTQAPACHWATDGESMYSIKEAPEFDESGTKIIIHLSDDNAKYAEKGTILGIIKEHSNFVPAPVFVDGERANSPRALWYEMPNNCKKEDYEAFYDMLTHGRGKPMYTLHYQADAPLSIKAILYVPDQRPSALMPNSEAPVSLYSRRVLIQRDGKGIVPQWLRFLIGVIDSEDIPLNLSREMMQVGPVLEKLRSAMTARVVKFFQKEMVNDKEKYHRFFEYFGVHFKEAIIAMLDPASNADIAHLLLFDSSNCRQGVKTTLADYVKRMQENQTHIYYAHVANREHAEHNAFYEAMRSTGMEVLFVSDVVDEMVLFHLQNFNGKIIMSAENWFKSQQPSDKKKKEIKEYKGLVEFISRTLGPKKAETVEILDPDMSIDQPCLVTTPENESVMRTYGAMARDISEENRIMLMRPKLLINSKHPIVRRLDNIRKNDNDLAEMLAEQMWVNAMTAAGLLLDARSRVAHLNQLLTKLVERSSTESGILTPDSPRIIK